MTDENDGYILLEDYLEEPDDLNGDEIVLVGHYSPNKKNKIPGGDFNIYISPEFVGLIGPFKDMFCKQYGNYGKWPQINSGPKGSATDMTNRGYVPGATVNGVRLLLYLATDVSRFLLDDVITSMTSEDGLHHDMRMDKVDLKIRDIPDRITFREFIRMYEQQGNDFFDFDSIRNTEIKKLIMARKIQRRLDCGCSVADCKPRPKQIVCDICNKPYIYCKQHDSIITYRVPNMCQCGLDQST